MKKLKAAVNRATEDAAVYMTAELRNNALEHGWHPEVVSSMSVVHNSGSYHVQIHPDYQDRAFVHEFGDENTPPTAAIRKYSSSNGQQKAFMTLFNKHYRGKK